MKKTLLLLLFFTVSFGYAQDWKYLLDSKYGVYYFKPNTRTTAWIKVVSDRTTYYPCDDVLNPKTIDGYTIFLYKFSCSSKKMGVLQSSVYSKSGDLLQVRSIDEFLVDMDRLKSDSVGEQLLFTMCYGN